MSRGDGWLSVSEPPTGGKAWVAQDRCPRGNGMAMSLAGFDGERQDPLSGMTHLGNGYRAFSPVLMRFDCPDSFSPFGVGGLNPYTYCAGDPINRMDPSGHWSWQGWLGIGLGVLGLGFAIFTAGSSIAAAGGGDGGDRGCDGY
jgi:RHS repeat-associated protein